MDTATLNCPFCCDETFDSPETLKIHILDILNKLQCPICKKKISSFENFTQHLKECVTVENFSIKEFREEQNTNEENDNSIQDYLSSEEKQEDCEYYCEICKVYFVQIKKHLMENHMGQQVVVESQDLDGILGESEVSGQDETEERIETKPETNTSETEHIFIEQEILDEDGKFYTKKLTKLNIVPELERQSPVVEQLFYEELANVNSKIENTIRVYRCQVCNIRFSQLSSYNKHDCNLRKGEVCNICSVHCSTKSWLLQHKKRYHGEIISRQECSVCEVCHIEFPSEKSMMLHKRMHAPITKQRIIDPPATYNINGTKVSEESNETFTCEICGKEYNKKYEEVHMKSHNEVLLNCSICNREFPDKDDLSLHLQAHGNEVEKKMSCRFCKKPFSIRESLDDHIENQCDGRKYSCNFCGKKFLKPHEMVKHERIHTGHKPYICQICGKGFRVSYCLTLHMRTHSGIRPYQCQICDKRFKSHGAYSHHVQIHSDVRSYQCPFCPKAFKTAVQLAAHKNTHTKPFSCNICNRPFASLYAVRQHTKSHDRKNELKHQCHVCGAEYVRYSALKDHLGTHSACVKKDLEQSPKKIRKRKIIKDEG